MNNVTTVLNAKLTGLERENNSSFGNPSYIVFLRVNGEKLQLKTLANAGFVYAIDKSWVGKDVHITYKHYTRFMRLIDMEIAQ